MTIHWSDIYKRFVETKGDGATFVQIIAAQVSLADVPLQKDSMPLLCYLQSMQYGERDSDACAPRMSGKHDSFIASYPALWEEVMQYWSAPPSLVIKGSPNFATASLVERYSMIRQAILEKHPMGSSNVIGNAFKQEAYVSNLKPLLSVLAMQCTPTQLPMLVHAIMQSPFAVHYLSAISYCCPIIHWVLNNQPGLAESTIEDSTAEYHLVRSIVLVSSTHNEIARQLRAEMIQMQLYPKLCIEISLKYCKDLLDFFDEMIMTAGSDINEHWLFKRISQSAIESVVSGILSLLENLTCNDDVSGSDNETEFEMKYLKATRVLALLILLGYSRIESFHAMKTSSFDMMISIIRRWSGGGRRVFGYQLFSLATIRILALTHTTNSPTARSSSQPCNLLSMSSEDGINHGGCFKNVTEIQEEIQATASIIRQTWSEICLAPHDSEQSNDCHIQASRSDSIRIFLKACVKYDCRYVLREWCIQQLGLDHLHILGESRFLSGKSTHMAGKGKKSGTDVQSSQPEPEHPYPVCFSPLPSLQYARQPLGVNQKTLSKAGPGVLRNTLVGPYSANPDISQSPFISRAAMKLLEGALEVDVYTPDAILAEFVALDMPETFSSIDEYAGDWLSAFCVLLGCDCFASCTENVNGRIRSLALQVMRNVHAPLHTWTTRFADWWMLRCSFSRADTDTPIGNGQIQGSQASRQPSKARMHPLYPSEVDSMTAPLKESTANRSVNAAICNACMRNLSSQKAIERVFMHLKNFKTDQCSASTKLRSSSPQNLSHFRSLKKMSIVPVTTARCEYCGAMREQKGMKKHDSQVSQEESSKGTESFHGKDGSIWTAVLTTYVSMQYLAINADVNNLSSLMTPFAVSMDGLPLRAATQVILGNASVGNASNRTVNGGADSGSRSNELCPFIAKYLALLQRFYPALIQEEPRSMLLTLGMEIDPSKLNTIDLLAESRDKVHMLVMSAFKQENTDVRAISETIRLCCLRFSANEATTFLQKTLIPAMVLIGTNVVLPGAPLSMDEVHRHDVTIPGSSMKTLQYLWEVWLCLYEYAPSPADLELATVNSLLKINVDGLLIDREIAGVMVAASRTQSDQTDAGEGLNMSSAYPIRLQAECPDSTRPRSVTSYESLIQEPALLFRLDVCLHGQVSENTKAGVVCAFLTNPGICRIVTRITKTLLINSRSLVYVAVAQKRVAAENGSNVMERSAFDVLQPKKHNGSTAETGASVDPSQYTDLQEIIVARLIRFLWIHVQGRVARLYVHDKRVDVYHDAHTLSETRCHFVDVLDWLMTFSPQLCSYFLHGGVDECTFALLASGSAGIELLANHIYKAVMSVSKTMDKADPPSIFFSGAPVEDLVRHLILVFRYSTHHDICRKLALMLPRFLFRMMIAISSQMHRSETAAAEKIVIQLVDLLSDKYPFLQEDFMRHAMIPAIKGKDSDKRVAHNLRETIVRRTQATNMPELYLREISVLRGRREGVDLSAQSDDDDSPRGANDAIDVQETSVDRSVNVSFNDDSGTAGAANTSGTMASDNDMHKRSLTGAADHGMTEGDESLHTQPTQPAAKRAKM